MIKNSINFKIVISCFLVILVISSCKQSGVPDYKNPKLSIQQRVKDLLSAYDAGGKNKTALLHSNISQ